jgi:hypothetical protein
MTSISRFKHDCVIYIDQWQNEDIGKIEVTNQYIEFISDNRQFILDFDGLQEVKIEGDIVRVFDNKNETYFLRFLQRPPYQKRFSNKTYYDNDEPSSRKFVSLVYSIMRVKKTDSKVKEKVIVKETVLIPCPYCGGLMPQTATFCPECGARKK